MTGYFWLRALFTGFVLFLNPLLGTQAAYAEQKEVKLCLAMVVENEGAVIEACLNSVRGIVDCIAICDMNSTDSTRKIIKKFIEETGIPGEIYQVEARHAANKKALSAQYAQHVLSKKGFSLSETYLLLLDADLELNVGSSFDKNALTADAYLVLGKYSAPSYGKYGVHLVLASKSEGGLEMPHLPYQPSNQCMKLGSLTLHDHEGEPYRTDQLKRKMKEASEGLKKEPSNAHYLFELAQLHKAEKDYEQAVKEYQNRCEKGGNSEEIWFSKCMIGECYEALGRWDQALYSYLEAYQFNPKRAEPLRNIALYYREHGQNDLAYLFAKQGSRIPFPEDQILFSSYPLHHYQFDEELSIAAYYTPYREEGFDAVNDLVLRKNVPWYIKQQAYHNMQYYMHRLPDAQFKPIDIDLPLIQKDSNERYHPMNPSIVKTENGYDVICRTVNFTQTGAKIFQTTDPTGIFRTRNFLVRYDRHFNLLDQREIVENLSRSRRRSFNIEGLEDCRMVAYDKNYWFTCTTFDTNPTGHPQISLCKLADAQRTADKTIQVEKLVPLLGPDPHRCEKNWLPFTIDNQLYAIYSYDPLMIFQPNRETGACETVHYDQPKHDFSHFRGSAAPIALDGGYLLLVHEVGLHPNEERFYMHRFLYLDGDFKIKKLSKPFIFQHIGIEYCAGMVLDHAQTHLVMTIGIEDREAHFCFVDLQTIRAMLSVVTF